MHRNSVLRLHKYTRTVFAPRAPDAPTQPTTPLAKPAVKPTTTTISTTATYAFAEPGQGAISLRIQLLLKKVGADSAKPVKAGILGLGKVLRYLEGGWSKSLLNVDKYICVCGCSVRGCSAQR